MQAYSVYGLIELNPVPALDKRRREIPLVLERPKYNFARLTTRDCVQIECVTLDSSHTTVMSLKSNKKDEHILNNKIVMNFSRIFFFIVCVQVGTNYRLRE